MKERPWIWLIVANVIFIAGIMSLVIVAVHYKQPEVPLQEVSDSHGF